MSLFLLYWLKKQQFSSCWNLPVEYSFWNRNSLQNISPCFTGEVRLLLPDMLKTKGESCLFLVLGLRIEVIVCYRGFEDRGYYMLTFDISSSWRSVEEHRP